MTIKICEPGGGGLVLPLFESEQEWPKILRGLLYACGMIYTFMGVAMIADTFMAAIEEVTSRRKQVSERGRKLTKNVWNETVANLSLMALGSSAPEIALSVIELLRNNFYAGELGSSTIVGSAAFNLFVIVAVCIVSIPDGETRQITGLPVFYITAAFSVFAYLWLVLVLGINSPDIVTIPEALATLLFLPLLVWLSYYADVSGIPSPVQMFKRLSQGDEDAPPEAKVRRGNQTKMMKDQARSVTIRQSVNFRQDGASSHGVGSAGLASMGPGMGRSSAKASQIGPLGGGRASAGPAPRRSVLGRQSIVGARNSRQSVLKETSAYDEMAIETQESDGNAKSHIQFLVTRQCVSASLRTKKVLLVRSGDLQCNVDVTYSVHLSDGHPSEGEIRTAMQTYSYPNKPRAGREVYRETVHFPRDEKHMEIDVRCPDRFDSCFLVLLQSVQAEPNEGEEFAVPGAVATGMIRWTYVVKAPDSTGVLAWSKDSNIPAAGDYVFVPGSPEAKEVQLVVMRQGGCLGEASCTYRTEKFSAVPGIDFEEADDVLEFPEGATERIVTIQVLGKAASRVQDEFFVIMQDGSDSIKFNELDDGGEDEGILTVQIGSLTDDFNFIKKLDKLINIDAFRAGNAEWKDQFPAAIFVGGDRESQEEAGAQDWFWHIVFLPWKLLFCFVPPTSYAGGWVCFYTSLAFIGGTTAFVADLAELFGCVFDVPDMVTAITFVALGTSMPDLFASLSAAKDDPSADASVVNVTGSNSVNVFLGLGLPWTFASIYWTVAGGSTVEEWSVRFPEMAAKVDPGRAVFVVNSGDLAFSVVAFSICCLAALTLLIVRRSKVDCELGGPRPAKIATGVAFVILWLSYITLASWRAIRSDQSSSEEWVGMLLGVGIVGLVACCVPLGLLHMHKPEEEEQPLRAIKEEPEEDGKPQDPRVADDTDGVTGSAAIHVSGAVACALPLGGGGGGATGPWKPIKETQAQDWDRLFRSIPSERRALCTLDLERGRGEMERAVAQESEAMLVESRAHSADAVLKLLVDRFGLAEKTVAEVLKLLGLVHSKASTTTSTATLASWFNRMAVLLCAGVESQALAQALYDEAVQDNVWVPVARLVAADRLEKWGAPSFVVDDVSSEEHDLRSLDSRILSQDSAGPVQFLQDVATCIKLDPYQDILRPILKARLVIWGIHVDNGSDLLEKLIAGAKTNSLKGLLARSILSDRTCLDDWIQLCDAINLDPVVVFLTPLLQAYLQRVGFESQDSQIILDRILAMANFNKVRTAIDSAVLGQMAARASSEASCQAFGIKFVPGVIKPILRACLMRIGLPEDLAFELITALPDSKGYEVLAAFSNAFSKEVGFFLTDLNVVGAALGVDSLTLCQSIMRSRLTAWSCPETKASIMTEALKDISALQSVSAEFSRTFLGNRRSVQDIKAVCGAVSFEDLPGILQPMFQATMTMWSLSADDAKSFSEKCTQAHVILESGDVLTRLFLQGAGVMQDLLALCASVGMSPAALLTPLVYAACVKCGLPAAEAQAIAEKAAAFEVDSILDALNNIVGAIISDKKPHVDDFLELCRSLDVDFVSVMQQVVELFFTVLGVSEHEADIFSSRTTMEFVLEFKDALSAAVLNKEPTVEYLRQLGGGAHCVDPLALIFRPVLQSTLTKLGVPVQETETIAQKVEDLQAVEDAYNRAVLAVRPTAEAIAELCIAIGVDASSRVLRPALQVWLEQHGIRKTDAAGVAQKVLHFQKRDVVLLQNTEHMDSLSQLCAALDTDIAKELLRPVLQRHLTAWGFSASESAEAAAQATQIGPYRQAQRIITSAVLTDQGSMDDVLHLGSMAGVDPLLVLVKPMVRHSASKWGASPNTAESLASEASLKHSVHKHGTIIARAVFRSQPNLVAVECFLAAFGITIDTGVHIPTQLTVTAAASTEHDPSTPIGGNEGDELQRSPKRTVKKSVRRKTRDAAAVDGEGPDGEPGEGAISKPKKSVKVKKSLKARESTAGEQTLSPSGPEVSVEKVPDDENAAVGAD